MVASLAGTRARSRVVRRRRRGRARRRAPGRRPSQSTAERSARPLACVSTISAQAQYWLLANFERPVLGASEYLVEKPENTRQGAPEDTPPS